MLLIILLCCICSVVLCVSTHPQCADLERTPIGSIDVEKTLFNCVANIGGSMFPPSYFDTVPTVVNISTSINTLINVDDVNAQVTLDIYMRIAWIDPRINLPSEVWNELNPAISKYEGLEITPYIQAQNQLNIWQPDIRIMETVASTTQAELMHLFKDGSFFWSRHLAITITQAQMDLHDYPNDIQYFQLTFQSFSFSSDFVQLYPLTGKGFASLNTLPGSSSPAITLNRLWTYNEFAASSLASKSSIYFHKSREFSTVTLNLFFSRKSFGILLRMVVPVVIFMLIVAMTFWADIGKRIDITVQMLLVVSSLYFIIGQIIPFVGYFTSFDIFITVFFAILGITMILHFMTYQLETVKNKYPLAYATSEGLVLLARILAVPISSAIVLKLFPDPPIYFKISLIALVVLVLVCAFGSGRKCLKTFYFALCKLRYLKETREYKQVMMQNKALLNKGNLDTDANHVHAGSSNDQDIGGSRQSKQSADDENDDSSSSSLMSLRSRAEIEAEKDGGVSFLVPALTYRDKQLTTNTASDGQTKDTFRQSFYLKQQDNLTTQTMTTIPTVDPPLSAEGGLANIETMLSTLMTTVADIGKKEDDELSDIDTIDTAVEHHHTKEHVIGKMKADADIAYDLYCNQDSQKKHQAENLVMWLFQQVECCDYHKQLRELIAKNSNDETNCNAKKNVSGMTSYLLCNQCLVQPNRNTTKDSSSGPSSLLTPILPVVVQAPSTSSTPPDHTLLSNAAQSALLAASMDVESQNTNTSLLIPQAADDTSSVGSKTSSTMDKELPMPMHMLYEENSSLQGTVSTLFRANSRKHSSLGIDNNNTRIPLQSMVSNASINTTSSPRASDNGTIAYHTIQIEDEDESFNAARPALQNTHESHT